MIAEKTLWWVEFRFAILDMLLGHEVKSPWCYSLHYRHPMQRRLPSHRPSVARLAMEFINASMASQNSVLIDCDGNAITPPNLVLYKRSSVWVSRIAARWMLLIVYSFFAIAICWTDASQVLVTFLGLSIYARCRTLILVYLLTNHIFFINSLSYEHVKFFMKELLKYLSQLVLFVEGIW